MPKYTHRWSIICQKCLVDKNDNNLSLISILEELTFVIPKTNTNSNNFVIPITFDIVSFWDNNLEIIGDLNFCIEAWTPDKKKIFGVEPKFKIDNTKKRIRTMITINGLKTKPIDGEYLFFIKQKEESNKYKTVAEVPINIRIKN